MSSDAREGMALEYASARGRYLFPVLQSLIVGGGQGDVLRQEGFRGEMPVQGGLPGSRPVQGG